MVYFLKKNCVRKGLFWYWLLIEVALIDFGGPSADFIIDKNKTGVHKIFLLALRLVIELILVRNNRMPLVGTGGMQMLDIKRQ